MAVFFVLFLFFFIRTARLSDTHKAQSSKIILPYTKHYFPVSPFVNVYLNTRMITIGTVLTHFEFPNIFPRAANLLLHKKYYHDV